MLFGKTLDKQLGRQPRKIQFCTKCVVSNQRPRITFDENGVCSACQFAHLKHHVIDWDERESMLVNLLDRHRSTDGSYDCIVPGSGGKDSAYVCHTLKYKYGMHPLTITWAPFMYTDIGWRNYVAFKDSGFDSLLFFPNGKLHRKLARLALELHGDAWDPFAYGQKNYAFHAALKFNIPLIFYGESGEVEYGGSTKNITRPFEDPADFRELYYKGSGLDELVEHGLQAGVFSPQEIADNPFEFYRTPPAEAMHHLNPEMHWMSYYKKWIPQENYYHAAEHTGFKANPERSEGTYSKYASIDDKTDGFHFYLAYIKFGIARATSDAAHEIRDGHLTRDEGVALVKRFDGEFPKRHYSDFLEYLGITDAEFWEIVDKYRAMVPHVWTKIDGEWKLRHNVWGGGVDD
ncbi:MAG: N-acetyl sugar amidotransferase [Roseimicrobium sp.]